MSREEFDTLVQEGFLLIPERFRERIQNVALLVEDEPSEEVRIREGLSEHETLLGLYQGIPATVRGDSYGIGPTVPDTITLFKLPIEEAGVMFRKKFVRWSPRRFGMNMPIISAWTKTR